MVTGGLRSDPKLEHVRYLRARQTFPIQKQHTSIPPDTVNDEYDKLKRCIKLQAPHVERQAKASWITNDTWKLIDAQTSKNKNRSFQPGERQRLSRRIKRALQRDCKQRTIKSGDEIEHNLQAGRLKTAWRVLQTWYKHTGDRPPRPTRLDLRKITNEYKELYRANPTFDDLLDIHLTPFLINDGIPDNHEIATAVRKLRNGKAPGPTGLRAEHLKTLLQRAENSDATPEDCLGWEQVCHTVKSIFETGQIPEEMTWSVLVLIPKSSGGTRGIGLLDILWKVCSSIINTRLQDAILFHNSLHGFRKGRGTGTASLEAKLQMQLAHIRGIPLFQIFLDLSKAYDTMD
jgi:hypothetical protein